MHVLGWRPEIPATVQYHWPELVDLIRRCWSDDTGARPKASEVHKALRTMEKIKRNVRLDALLNIKVSNMACRYQNEVRTLNVTDELMIVIIGCVA